jgi:hypothetical protein
MKKLSLIFAYILFSLPFTGNAQDNPKVNVKVDTPVGQVEVNKPPPPQPVVVVQPPAQPRTVVVEKEAPAPAAPSTGCHCSLIPSHASAIGILALMPAFSLPFFLRFSRHLRIWTKQALAKSRVSGWSLSRSSFKPKAKRPLVSSF